MSATVTDALGRVKATAASHGETYVWVDAADLAALCTHAAVAPTPLGKTLAGVAEGAALTRSRRVGLHRAAHLDPLLGLMG